MYLNIILNIIVKKNTPLAKGTCYQQLVTIIVFLEIWKVNING